MLVRYAGRGDERNNARLSRRATVHYRNDYCIDPNVTKRWFIILTTAVLLFVTACDSQGEQDDFAADASATPSGFVRTIDGSEILDDDLDDWRTAPIYAGKVSIRPAYPNPAAFQDFATVPFSVTAFNSVVAPVQLKARRDGNGPLITLETIDQAGDPGSYAMTFSAARLGRTGLHRLFIFDAAGELVSYGDLMVQ